MIPRDRIDPSSSVPLHKQVYDAIRRAILVGELEPSQQLPPTRTLAEALSLSRATVAEAYDQLRTEGYIHARHGSGTFVAPDLPSQQGQDRRHDAARLPGPALSPRLSRWGQRVAAPEAELVLSPRTFEYDLRPHRIASDIFPWETWRAAVDGALSDDRDALLGPSPPAGHPDLLEAVARHVTRYRAVRCEAGQIVIVNGTQQGLNLLAALLLSGGERVAMEDPGYPAARLTFEARGLDVSRVPVDRDGLRVDAFEEVVHRAGRSAPRLVHVTPSHQDPTGATLTLSRRLALLQVAARAGCLVVEDDYDSEFRFEGRPVESLQGLDTEGLVIYAGTFSKSLLPSLRIGYLILPPHLVRPFVAAKSIWDSGAPLLEQAALARFMAGGEFERHIRRMRRLYRDRRDALVSALLNTFDGRVMVGERHGGLNVLVTLDVREPEERVVARAAERGIGLRGAATYYSSPPRRPTFLMGFAGLPEDQIHEGVAHLGEILSRSRTAATSDYRTASDLTGDRVERMR